MRKKYAVYTVITGEYDQIKPVKKEANIDFYIVTDDLKIVPNGWILLKVERDGLSPIEYNRKYKMKSHLLFSNYELTLYIDANIEIKSNISELISKALKHNDIALYDHPVRTSIFDEADALKKIGYDYFFKINNQMNRYKNEGFISNEFFECNIIFRKHNSDRVIKAMEDWCYEFENGIKRDQLSLTYVCYKNDLNISKLGLHDARFSNKYFRYRNHLKRNSSANYRAKFLNRLFRLFNLS